jgi:hypothetical protein
MIVFYGTESHFVINTIWRKAHGRATTAFVDVWNGGTSVGQ